MILRIIYIISALLFLCTDSFGGQGMGPGPGFKTSSGGSGGIAIRDIKYNSDSSSNTALSTISGLNVATNDLIVCFVSSVVYDFAYYDDYVNVDCGTNSLTFTKLSGSTANTYGLAMYYKAGATASTDSCVLTTDPAEPYRSIQCASYSGVATSSALDVSSCNSAGCDTLATSSTNLTAQNVTTTASGELMVFGGMQWSTPKTFTPGSGYSFRGTNDQLMSLSDKISGAIGTYPNQTVETVPTADQYLSIFATFKAAP